MERSSDAFKVPFLFGELLVLNLVDNVVRIKVETRSSSNFSDLIVGLSVEKFFLLEPEELAFFDLDKLLCAFCIATPLQTNLLVQNGFECYLVFLRFLTHDQDVSFQFWMVKMARDARLGP